MPPRMGFGSGSPMIGQGGEVAQQMQNGAPAMNQMGSNAPGFTPGQQVQPYPSLPNSSPMSIMPNPQQTQPQAPAMAPAAPKAPKSESQLILEALMSRLGHITDLEKRVAGLK